MKMKKRMKTKPRILGLFLFLLGCLLAAGQARAAGQPAGEGTEASPYQITTADELRWFAGLVNGTLTDGTAQNAAAWATLQNDIDLGGEAWTPIGSYSASSSLKYTGTFDGAGHTISNLTVNNSSADYQGFVGILGSGGAIQNLTLDKNCSVTGNYYVGGVCGENYGTIENCANTGTVNGIYCVGGICGLNTGTIESCYNTGTVTGSSSVGGVCGENYGIIENCYNTGAVTGDYYVGGVCGDNYDIITNCCWLEGSASTGIGSGSGTATDVESKTAEEFASGEVCWLLNGLTSENVSWYQTLKTDSYPVLDSTHGVVYATGLNCAGQATGCSNTEPSGEVTKPDHQYDSDGICINCGSGKPALAGDDGVYQISSAGNLFWFAALVNGTLTDGTAQNAAASAVLLNDITIPEEMAWTPIGNYSVTKTQYTGTFDGAGHTISNLKIDSENNYQGFVGRLGSGGTIQNLTLDESCSVTGSDNVGGVCGTNSGTIESCYNTGTVNGSSDNVGGVCGQNSGTIESCYNTGTVTGSGSSVGGVCGLNDGTITNCYWLNTAYSGNGIGSGSGTATDVESKTAEEFASGEVCWLLNGKMPGDDNVWRQNLDNGKEKDTYPVLDSTHGVVYATGLNCAGQATGCSNTEPSGEVTKPDHQYDSDGICINCGSGKPALAGDDGVYQISSAGNLFWFAALVNGTLTDGTAQNAAASAVLLNDITIPEEMAWTPIGNYSVTKTQYTGTFDGAGHTISNLKIDSENNYQGFVGFLGSGGAIQNLTLDKSCSVSGDTYVGGVCGCNYFNDGTITNCANGGSVTGSDYVGGICGSNSGTIENCANTGAVTGSGDMYVGGVCGRNYSTIKNCANTGAVTGSDYVGGVCGQMMSSSTIENCYNTGTVIGDGNVGGVCGDNYRGTITNCYWLNTSYSTGIGDGSGTNVAAKTAEEFASGEVTWLLNGSTSEGETLAWYQNLGNSETVDDYPVLDSSHGIVYHAIDCKSEEAYSNSPINDGHQYDADGVCTVCGVYQPAGQENDIYQITNAGQLFWFAALVNGDADIIGTDVEKNAAASAVLTADITVPEGKAWTPIGNESNPYTGTFDGQGYTIDGMKIDNAESYSGLFGNVTGTVRDFTVTGSIAITGDETVSRVGGAVGSLGTASAGGTVSGVTSRVNITVSTGNDHIGGVVGSMPENCSPTVESCLYTGNISVTVAAGSVAGVVGYIRTGTIQNCANRGGISVSESGNGSVGGVLGYCNNKGISINSCYNTGSITAKGTANVGAIVGNNRDDNNHVGQATVSNCYYLTGSADKGQGQLTEDAAGTVVKTDDDFKDGAVAVLLQGSQTAQAWGQALGTDDYPLPTTDEAKRVYAAKMYEGSADNVTDIYTNASGISRPEGTNALIVIEDAVSAPAGTNVIVKDGDGAYICADLDLTDGADFYTPVAFTADKATYSRTLPSTSTWGTIVLPFAATEVSGASLYQAYDVVSDGSDESVLAVLPTGGNTLEANTPALFKGESADTEVSFSASGAEVAATADAGLTKAIGGSGYSLNGSMSTITLTTGDLFISKDQFWSVGTENKVGMQAFRAYIDAPSSSPAKSMRIMVGSTTDIRQALADGSRLVDVYSLQGILLRKGVESSKALNGLPAGVYVVGGKKVKL